MTGAGGPSTGGDECRRGSTSRSCARRSRPTPVTAAMARSIRGGGGGNSDFCFSRRPSAANASWCGACPERLDGRWFLGSSRDAESPNHGVLAKARARWRGAVFAGLFVRTVRECVGAGLVDGTTVRFDGCLVAAGDARDRFVKTDTATSAWIRAADGAQKRKRDETKPPAVRGETNRTRVSTTDPDGSGGSKGASSGPPALPTSSEGAGASWSCPCPHGKRCSKKTSTPARKRPRGGHGSRENPPARVAGRAGPRRPVMRPPGGSWGNRRTKRFSRRRSRLSSPCASRAWRLRRVS